MKKFLVAIALLGIVSVAVADIQAPPKSRQTPTRKLARGLANVLYGWTELPVTVWRAHESGNQATEFIVYGIINGLERTGARIAYGVYEVVNFHRPLYKDSYRPPYTSINYDPTHGFEEFPPQLGYLSTIDYVRDTSW